MERILLTAIITTFAWIHPATAISAFTESPLEPVQFINYELHRETLKSLRNEPPTDDGRGVLQPRKNLPSGENQPVQNIQSIANTDETASRNKAQPIQGVYNGRHYSKDEVIELIKTYSVLYGISESSPLCIAKLESGFNANSKNKNSTASGVFQYVSGTWRGTDEGKAGLSVFDADSNIRAAVKYMSIHKNTRPWTVAKSCPPIQTIN